LEINGLDLETALNLPNRSLPGLLGGGLIPQTPSLLLQMSQSAFDGRSNPSKYGRWIDPSVLWDNTHLGRKFEAVDIISMKRHLLSLIAVAGLVGLVVGCNRSIESASQEFNSLPPVVQKAIRAEAPNAEIAKIDRTTANGVEAYEVEFREPGTNPKLVVAVDGRILSSGGISKTDGVTRKVERALTPTGAVGTKFSALPPSVQKAIQANAPAGEITDISREEDNGRVIYKIEFKDQGKNPSMRVSEDGTVVQDLQK